MNKTKDNFTTPKQTKRLGLKRNNSVLENTVENTSVLPRRLPQSDVRVNYRNSESQEEPIFHTPGTPKSSSELQRQAVSTNCRPFRLSLSKKIREKMTKKRLEFHLANENERDEEENESKLNQEASEETNEATICQDYISKSHECEASKDNTEEFVAEDGNKTHNKEETNNSSSKILGNMSTEELKAQIEILRTDLNVRQEHVKRVQELKQAIDIWKIGFTSALSDLQQKTETRLDTKTLLDHLKIPQEMLKYIND